jgi:hypothetical protein
MTLAGGFESMRRPASGHVALHDKPETNAIICDTLMTQTLNRRINMSLQTHLKELERKHRALEDAIHKAAASPSSSDTSLSDLKRRKLQLKDEISRLKKGSAETGSTLH